MAELKDVLSSGSLLPANLRADAFQGTEQALRSLAEAKSGKDLGPTSSPAASSIAESVAAQQAGRQVQALDLNAGLQQQGIQQAAQANKEVEQAELVNLNEQRIQQQEEYQQKLSSMLAEFDRQGEQLDFSKQKSLAEATGALMRLSSDKYLSKLDAQARKDGLNSETQAREALARSVFADELDLFKNDLSFRTYLGAEERKAKDMLSQISLDSALAIAQAEESGRKAAAFWSGVGNTGSAVTELATKSSSAKPAYTENRFASVNDLGITDTSARGK